MIGNTLNLVNYHREEDILVLNWYMGGSSCVGSGLDKNYHEEWQIITRIIELMSSGVDSQPPGRKTYTCHG